MSEPIKTIEDLKPDPRNANKGTPRGHGIIEQSVRQRGAGRSGLAARDGTMIAGSQTLQKMAELGIPIRPVHTTGEEWVVVIRDDIEPGSEDATLLAVEDNRSSEVGLEWDADVLASLAEENDLSSLFRDDELAAILAGVGVEPGGGGDEFDTTPVVDGPTRTTLGDLWSIGDVHRLIVGDCTDPSVVERLMGGERAQALITDPPYGVDKAQWDGAFPPSSVWYLIRQHLTEGANAIIFPGVADLPPKVQTLSEVFDYQWLIAWYKSNAMQFGKTGFSVLDVAWWFSCGTPAHRPQTRDVIVDPIVPSENNFGHPSPKPLGVITPLTEEYSPSNGIILDTFAGTGSLLVAAHRTRRRAFLAELSPRYTDVILRRAEAEGLTCVRVEP